MSLVLDSQVSVPIASGYFNNGWTNGGFLYVLNASQYVLSFAVQNANVPFSVFPGQQWVIPIVPGDSNIRISSTLFTSTTLANILYYKVFTDYSDVKDIPSGASLGFLANIVGGGVLTATNLVNNGNGAQDIVSATLAGNTSGFPNVELKNDGTTAIQGTNGAGFGSIFLITPGNPALVTLVGNVYLQSNTGVAPQTEAIFQLSTGFQESGFCGYDGNATAGGNHFGQGVNLKTNMTNTPSSITLTSIQNINSNTPGVFNVKKYGFNIAGTAVAAGECLFMATYATVGNCLLNFNEHEYMHHCDGCDTIAHASKEAVYVQEREGAYAMTHTCPLCGMMECFTTDLKEADIVSPLHRLTKDFCEHVLSTRS